MIGDDMKYEDVALFFILEMSTVTLQERTRI